MFELEVKCTFDAAHRVEGYPWKCDRLHGHTWTIAAKVQGKQLDSLGMLVDFKLLNQALKDVAATLDHQWLNELPAFRAFNTSKSAKPHSGYIFLANYKYVYCIIA